MTRLIDADKIEYTSIAHLASYPIAPSPCDTVMRAEINAMPTVEAIPVEWIKKFAEESKRHIQGSVNNYTYMYDYMLSEWKQRKEE